MKQAKSQTHTTKQQKQIGKKFWVKSVWVKVSLPVFKENTWQMHPM